MSGTMADLQERWPFQSAKVALSHFDRCGMGRTWDVDKSAWCRCGTSRVVRLVLFQPGEWGFSLETLWPNAQMNSKV